MVVVNGDIESVQSSIDFYLKITSCDSGLSDESLQKKFFSIFEEEDKYRKENFLEYQEEVIDDYKINYTEDLVLADGEELYEEGTNYFAFRNPKVETTYDFVDDEAEEEDFSELDSIEEDEEVYETEEDDDDEVVQEWAWGSDESDSVEEIEEVPEVYETEEDDDDDLVVQKYIIVGEKPTKVVEEVKKVEVREPKKVQEVVAKKKVEELDFDDILAEEVEVKNKVIPSQPKAPVEQVVTSYEEEPRDLRDFVKKHPNCEMAFALKYFTRKEIDFQLSKGRVFKRKGKLLI